MEAQGYHSTDAPGPKVCDNLVHCHVGAARLKNLKGGSVYGIQILTAGKECLQ